MQRKRSKFRDKKKKIYKKFKNRTAREARKKKKKLAIQRTVSQLEDIKLQTMAASTRERSMGVLRSPRAKRTKSATGKRKQRDCRMETSIDETLGRTAVALPSRRASKDERAGREVQKPPYNMAAVGAWDNMRGRGGVR